MGGTRRETTATAEELLAHTAWLRRLALRLVGDADAADDLVQETWIAAAKRSPEARDSLRPWLAKVLRDAFRMRARSEGRRSAREQAASLVTSEVPTPERLLARAEAHQRLATLVLELEEPYRSAVLLHFFEGVSLADIARVQGIPAGTVRWRVKVAVNRLRAELDRSGDRKQWAVALLALPKGALVAHRTSKTAAVVLLLLALLVGSAIVLLVHHRGAGTSAAAGGPGDHHPGAASASGAARLRGSHGDLLLPAWLGQRGLEPRRIAGRVRNHDGGPVPGATVVLESLATAGGLASPPHRITDAAGAFDFGPELATTYTVAATAPGMTGAIQEVNLRDPTAHPRPDRLELTLGPCADAMVGTVSDASGGPIAGARIAWLSNTTLRAGTSIQADDSGTYQLCLESGFSPVTVEVSAAGYGAIRLRTSVWGRQRFDFSLVPEAVVVGRVTREDTGAPVPRAHVHLTSDWFVERTAPRGAFTGKDGRFRITGVAPGSHLLTAIGDELATARATPITVAAGQTTDPVELVLETRSTLRGVVTAGGKRVAGARVTATAPDPNRHSASAVSQEDGSFVLDRVPRGPVRFSAPPYEVVKPTSFTVNRPEQDGLTIEVAPLGAIAGQVVRGNRPVEGALVEVHGPNSWGMAPIHSGPDGRFEARGLRPGMWAVTASSERDGAFGKASKPIQVARGRTAEVTIDLAYAASISGVVVDQDGAPVAGIRVGFFHTGTNDAGFATTAMDGSFRAAMMAGGGQYRVQVHLGQGPGEGLRPAAGGAFPLVSLEDGSSQVTGLVLAVRRDRLSISGRVVDQSGAPVPDTHVAAQRTQPGVQPSFRRWLQEQSTTTDVDGQFTIGDLSAGTYALEARSSAGASVIAQGIQAGRTDVEVVLPSPGSIQGTLTGFKQPPEVWAMRQDSRTVDAPAVGQVSGNGFVISSLSPGTYLVSATSLTEAASARVKVAPGTPAPVTLTAAGSAVVSGRVRDFQSGAPVEGMTCVPEPRIGATRSGGPPIGNNTQTDAQGAFELAAVPAGDLAIVCWNQGGLYTSGIRLVTAETSQHLAVDVPVVKIRQDVSSPLGGLGAEFDAQTFIARLYRVQPGGPAASAGFQDGDIVTAVDGASVTELSPMGVRFLIINRPPGTAIKVTVRRADQTVTANVTLGPTDQH